MKSLIINDLHYNPHKSIIPYCLKFCRDTSFEPQFLHVVDQRNFQGKYSPISDSQSITPAVQPYEEIIEKEKSESALLINRFLSKELPLVNYPLNVKTEIMIGYSEDIISKKVNEGKLSLIMINSNPVSEDETIIYNDIHYLLNNSKIPVLIIPAGSQYKKPVNIVFTDNLIKDDVDPICNAISIFKQLNSLFYVLSKKKTSVISDSVYCEKIMDKSDVQIELIKLDNEDFSEAVSRLKKSIEINLVITIRDNFNFFEKFFKKTTPIKLVRDLTMPVLVM